MYYWVLLVVEFVVVYVLCNDLYVVGLVVCDVYCGVVEG